MKTDQQVRRPTRFRVGGASLRRAPWTALTFAIALVTMVVASAVMAGCASANSYSGLLSASASVNVPALIGGVPAGSVYDQQSWSAPSGVQFHGFAYTAGSFWVQNFDATGGISAGFKGSGGSAPTDLGFPWTTDCSVSEDDSPRVWINNDVSVSSSTKGPYASTNGYCGKTSGNTSGWNFTNAEVESTDPAVNPQADFQTLTLSVWCARDSACNNSDSGAASATNLSGNFEDSYDQPSGSASWNIAVGGNSWYQTNSGSVALDVSASDPAGVCSMAAGLSGPENIGSGALGNQNPGVVSEGSPVGEEFEFGTDPCWAGSTDKGSWTLPSGLASGTYGANLQASNPGNYQAQGFTPNGSPTVASYGDAINVDDSTPLVRLVDPTGSGSWTSSTTATVDVSTGPSGLGSLVCTENGSGVGATLQSRSGDSYVYSVPLDGGSDDLSCAGANNDANGALVGSSGTQLYQQDSVVPSITFSDGGYTSGTWTASAQIVTVVSTGGPSGVTGLSCTLDGSTLPDASGDTDTVGAAGMTQTAYVTVAANGAHDLSCSAENAGTPTIFGSGAYQVDVDSQIPVASFVSGDGYAATSTQSSDPRTASGQNWLNGSSGSITVGVSGTEPTVESGVEAITCVVNGYASHSITLSNAPVSGTVAQHTPFVATFTANPANGWIDGQNAVSCSAGTLAGLAGADGRSAGTSSVEYVDVNDAEWPATTGTKALVPTAGLCGISSVIDNGDCAYSNGPSQTKWYATSQTVEITADDTGAAAPITSITCSGPPMPVSSWTAANDPQDVDGHNGMTVIATIEAPGGRLDCSASDSADPADTYELGTYSVSIDPSSPKGFFEPQGYRSAARNIIQLRLADNPSGIARVTVRATDENTGVVYSGAELTSNPADGDVAYATLDQNTGTWNLTVNPGVFPGVNDRIRLVATATTGAGVTAEVGADEAGAAEVVTPGLLGQNPTVVSGWSRSGDATAITATAAAGRWVAAGTRESELPASLNATSANPVAPTSVATVASRTRLVCRATSKKGGAAARRGSTRARGSRTRRGSCRARTSRAPRSEGLPARYGQETEIKGRLMDTRTKTAIAGGSILIYATNLATDRVRLVHIEESGRRGNFSYRLAAGPDRRIDLIYLGQWGLTHGADSAFDTTTGGRLRVHAARVVRVGQTMRVAGRILGGSIQAKGAIVQMQYAIVGQTRGWAPFKPGRSTSRGGFVIRYPITRGSAGLTYRIRIRVPTQAGWGFRGATSNVLRFHVR